MDWQIVEVVSIVIILLATGVNLGLTVQLIRNLHPDNIHWTHMVVRSDDGEPDENPPSEGPESPLPGHPAPNLGQDRGKAARPRVLRPKGL